MSRLSKSAKPAFPWAVLLALTGVAAIGLVSVAIAKTFTLTIAKNASVTNTSGTTVHEAIVVSSRQRAVYTLTGDSMAHPECTKANHCFSFWIPLTTTAKKPSAASGIHGKLTVWHRDGFGQLVLGGHPLYTLIEDKHADQALGDGIKSFGGTWHVIKTAGSTTPGTTMSTTTTTSTTPTYTYPATTTATSTTPTTTVPYY